MPVMPDTRIYGGGDSGGQSQSFNPLQTLGGLMQIKEQQAALKDRERVRQRQMQEDEDDDVTRQYLSQHERPEEAIDQLWKEGRSGAATKLAKNVYEERTARLNESTAKTKAHQERLEQAAQILGGVTDDSSYQPARKAVFDLIEPIYGAGANDMLPTVYDKGVIEKLKTAGTSRALQLQQANAFAERMRGNYQAGLIGADEWAESEGRPVDPKTGRRVNANVSEWSPNGLAAQEKHQETMAQLMAQATNQVAWDEGLKLAHEHGVPQVVIDRFGTWNPKTSPERAKQLGMTVRESASVDNAEERARISLIQAQTARERAAIAADKEDAANRKGVLTTLQGNAEKDRRDKDDAETEEFVQKVWADEHGKETPINYAELPSHIKSQYVDRRLKSHDKFRERLYGLPPLEEAAHQAAVTGDQGGFDKLRRDYEAITQGVAGSLDDIVSPPSPYRGVKSPEASAYRTDRVATIKAQLKKTGEGAPDARTKRRLLREIADLETGLR
jgi:hypothetical protein